jgi:hypothetical protein
MYGGPRYRITYIHKIPLAMSRRVNNTTLVISKATECMGDPGIKNTNILVVMTLNVISNVIDYIYKVIVI